MKTFLSKILFFILIIIAVDFASGLVLDYLYQNPKSGIAYQENLIINHTNQDILIFGSSRAAFHYVPDIFSTKTKLSAYNVGREGTGIYFHYAVLLATLERYKPKVVVLDLDFRDYYDRGGNFGTDGFKELLPFYGKVNSEFDSLITPDFPDRIFAQSNLYRYNKKFFSAVSGSIAKDKNNSNGYRQLNGQWDKVLRGFGENKLVADPKLSKTVEAFIHKAKEHDIKIFVVLSPNYRKIPKEFDTYANGLAERFDIHVLNHYNDSAFLRHYDYFNDEEHLNHEGAKAFSEKVASEIATVLEN